MNLTIGDKIGNVPVDSGQIIVVDPCYVLDTDDDNRKAYFDVCEVTLSEEGRGGLPLPGYDNECGFATSTIYGDGLYPVYEVYDSKRNYIGFVVIMGDVDE